MAVTTTLPETQVATRSVTEFESDSDVYLPPPGLPPLLTEDQLIQLATQGWLPLPLPPTATTSLQDLFKSLSHFFDQPRSTKEAQYPSKLGTEFGYYTVPGEKEYLTLRCHSPSSSPSPPAALEGAAATVWSSLATVLHRILADIARASSPALSHTVWDEILDGSLTLPKSEAGIATGTLLRLFRYTPGSGVADLHTDLGLLTLCVGDGARGLQMLDRELSPEKEGVDEERQVWIDADGPVVVVGQTLRALSNGMIRPGVHRVVASEAGRESVVFALRHSWKHMIDLGKFGADAEDKHGQEGNLVDPKKLWERLRTGVVNVNAKKEIREAQRRKRDEERRRRVENGKGEVVEEDDEDEEDGNEVELKGQG